MVYVSVMANSMFSISMKYLILAFDCLYVLSMYVKKSPVLGTNSPGTNRLRYQSPMG